MTKLSEEKGYQLIGSHRHGFNAFFIRRDLRPDFIKTVSPEYIHNNPATQRNQANEWPKLKHYPWEKV